MTSSIRTRSLSNESEHNIDSAVKKEGSSDSAEESAEPEEEEKELLLCLRPIRDGEKVCEDLRFNPTEIARAAVHWADTDSSPMPHTSVSMPVYNQSPPKDVPESQQLDIQPDKNRPPKKRFYVSEQSLMQNEQGHFDNQASARNLNSAGTPHGFHKETDEKSVIESLILMSNNQSRT